MLTLKRKKQLVEDITALTNAITKIDLVIKAKDQELGPLYRVENDRVYLIQLPKDIKTKICSDVRHTINMELGYKYNELKILLNREDNHDTE